VYLCSRTPYAAFVAYSYFPAEILCSFHLDVVHFEACLIRDEGPPIREASASAVAQPHLAKSPCCLGFRQTPTHSIAPSGLAARHRDASLPSTSSILNPAALRYLALNHGNSLSYGVPPAIVLYYLTGRTQCSSMPRHRETGCRRRIRYSL
jgi:hypothetical protein